MILINYIFVLILTTFALATAPPIEVVFFIQSQDTRYQNELSRNLKEDIIRQSIELQPKYRIKVHVLHEIFNYPGGWTIHNLIPKLMFFQQMEHMGNNDMNMNANTQIEMEIQMGKDDEKSKENNIVNDNTRWIIFCEDTTEVKVKLLMERLNNENHTQPIYLGHPLYDREPTIIHHFAFFENPKWFPYPMLRAGVVLSWPLFKSIADVYINHNSNSKSSNRFMEATTLLQQSEFSIDAAHELARFIYDNIQIPTTHHTTTTTKTSLLTDNKSNNNHNENVYHHTKGATYTASKALPLNTNYDTKDAELSPSNIPSATSINNEIIAQYNEEDITKPTSLNAPVQRSTTTTNTVTKKQKIILKKASYICPQVTWDTNSNSNSNNTDETTCAMYAKQATATAATLSLTCAPVKREEIYFAVKTCYKYHSERLPIIKATWASYAKYVKYYSDFQDDTIPTINIGMPNVEVGHCDKTLQILKLALKDIENYNTNNNKNNNKNTQRHQQHYKINQAKHEKNHQIKWLFLTDDDTLLSVSGVCQVLGCYDSMDEIYLGERYGYRLYAKDGFNYITGGGGIAFSLPVVKLILQHCSCPSATAPDDMILGSCLHSVQLKALHSSGFHQARPNDYSMELLKLEQPVSFHKFWQLDPFEVYKKWFEARDSQLLVQEQLQENLLAVEYNFNARKPLSKPEAFNFNEIPVSFVASLHHSKERHVDL